jgi:hypothetical protein
MSPDERGPIKIGFTTANPARRVISLQQASPYDLEWFASWKTTKSEDTQTLNTLKPYAIKREWFRPEPEVLSLIYSRCPEFDAQRHINFLMAEDERQLICGMFERRKRSRRTSELHTFSLRFGACHAVDPYELVRWVKMRRPPSEKVISIVRRTIEERGSNVCAEDFLTSEVIHETNAA